MSRLRLIQATLIAILLTAPSISFADDAPSIVQAAVERTDTDQLIRLHTSPEPKNVESRVVCSQEMTRIRLDGVFARKTDVEVIPVRDKGPITFVRLVSRGNKGSVIQLFAGKRNMSVCARTHVSYMSGEIIISTSMTDSEIARINKEKNKNNNSSGLRRVIITENEPDNEATKENGNEKVGQEPSDDKEDSKAATALFGKKTKESKENGQKKPFGNDETDGESELGAVRYAAGFGFAAIIGGVALFMLKRKKRLAGNDDGIEILSTKRIGPRQQLALASVQGKRFLLAINDKSISTLGELPQKETNIGNDFQEPQAFRQFAQELNGLSNAPSSEQVKMPVAAPQPAPKEKSETGQAPDVQARFEFGQELRKILSPAPIPAPTTPEPVEKSAAIPSNVAGLIAMARSRATYEKQSKKEPTVEA